MNNIRIDTVRSFVRWDRYVAFWVLVAGVLAWTWGYHAASRHHRSSGDTAPEAVPQPFRKGDASLTPISMQGPAVGRTGSEDKAELLRRTIIDFDPRQQPLDDYNQLILAARQDGDLRKTVREQFDKTQDPRLKARLGSLLIHVGTPDIKQYADDLLASSDGSKRSDGFRLLTAMDVARTDSKVRQQLISALDKETNAQALNSLVQGLMPGDLRPPQEVAAIVNRLSGLVQHADASVRAAAVGTLARWGEGDKVQELIMQAMSDPSPEVSMAAMYAASQAGIRNAQVKNQLFQMAAQDGADLNFRRGAATILGGYNLNAQDFERLMKLRESLGAPHGM